ncbi:hypothetical protein GBA52_008766 [Prunus armeniaca]|nr:hypothetical protein GBA52_008766 [Prunus armeniaca]
MIKTLFIEIKDNIIVKNIRFLVGYRTKLSKRYDIHELSDHRSHIRNHAFLAEHTLSLPNYVFTLADAQCCLSTALFCREGYISSKRCHEHRLEWRQEIKDSLCISSVMQAHLPCKVKEDPQGHLIPPSY